MLYKKKVQGQAAQVEHEVRKKPYMVRVIEEMDEVEEMIKYNRIMKNLNDPTKYTVEEILNKSHVHTQIVHKYHKFSIDHISYIKPLDQQKKDALLILEEAQSQLSISKIMHSTHHEDAQQHSSDHFPDIIEMNSTSCNSPPTVHPVQSHSTPSTNISALLLSRENMIARRKALQSKRLANAIMVLDLDTEEDKMVGSANVLFRPVNPNKPINMSLHGPVASLLPDQEVHVDKNKLVTLHSVFIRPILPTSSVSQLSSLSTGPVYRTHRLYSQPDVAAKKGINLYQHPSVVT